MSLEKLKVHASDEAEEEEEEELVDPLDTLKEKCSQKESCSAFHNKLEECNNRVNSRQNTAETCAEELFDFVHCVDHLSRDIYLHNTTDYLLYFRYKRRCC